MRRLTPRPTSCRWITGLMAKDKAAHEKHLSAMTSRQVAEHEARKKELAAQSAELAERERNLEAESRRVYDRERWVEQRAADLSNRLRGAA